MIKQFLNKYKFPIVAVALVWLFISFVQFFAISPLSSEIDFLKRQVEKRNDENQALKNKVKKDSIELAKSDKRIEALEQKELFFINLNPQIDQKYENEKKFYYSNDVIERRRIFSKYANE